MTSSNPSPWTGHVSVWQTSPSAPCERCDLVLVRVAGPRLQALMVDGAPGKSSARPRWPREVLFSAVGEAALEHQEPRALLADIGHRLRAKFRDRPWRLHAAAAALTWDLESGVLDLAEVGDTKGWRLERDRIEPLVEGGLPRPGRMTEQLLGGEEPNVRTTRLEFGRCSVAGERAVALLTDGAHALLTSTSGKLPSEQRGWSLDRVGADCASLLVITQPADH